MGALKSLSLPRVLESSLVIHPESCKGSKTSLSAEGVSTFVRVWESFPSYWFSPFFSGLDDSLKGTECIYVLS